MLIFIDMREKIMKPKRPDDCVRPEVPLEQFVQALAIAWNNALGEVQLEQFAQALTVAWNSGAIISEGK
ncbi:hypothetical protein J7K99_02590 [bacterium]|nr:hypothetical protein [bacterium]